MHLTSSKLSFFLYCQLKLLECLYTTPGVSKNEWVLLYKIVGLLLIYLGNQLFDKV